MSQPIMSVVEGSVQINRTQGTVTIQFDMFRAPQLARDAVGDIPGATLTHTGRSPDRALGGAERYKLVVEGDALRCSIIQNIIIATAANDRPDRAREVEALRQTDAS